MAHRTWMVMLEKGNGKEPRLWDHTSKDSALRRAHALEDLHSTQPPKVNNIACTIVIDASEYYGRHNG